MEGGNFDLRKATRGGYTERWARESMPEAPKVVNRHQFQKVEKKIITGRKIVPPPIATGDYLNWR